MATLTAVIGGRDDAHTGHCERSEAIYAMTSNFQ